MAHKRMCRHTEGMPAASCGECIADGYTDPPTLHTAGVFTARYEGACALCDARIDRGDKAVRLEGDSGRVSYAHYRHLHQ